jgi:hypothetical protein
MLFICIMAIIHIAFAKLCSAVKCHRCSVAPTVDTASDSQLAESGEDESEQANAGKVSPGSVSRKKLDLLTSGVASTRSLELNLDVPTKSRDTEAAKNVSNRA